MKSLAFSDNVTKVWFPLTDRLGLTGASLKSRYCQNGGGGNFATLPCCQVDTFCAFYEHRQGPLGQFIEVWLQWKHTCSRNLARIA